jgi:hypothetical protein
MVVYAVLAAETDTQYVRVYTTYPAKTEPGNTADTDVLDARVAITHGTTTFSFRDTTLERTDTHRSRIKAFVGYGVRLEGGRQYQLSVDSPTRGKAGARATALYRGNIITEPDRNGNVLVRVFPGSNARAYVLRMYLEYDLRIDSVVSTRRVEIPRSVEGNTGEFIYPKPVSREISSVAFSVVGYNQIVAQLRQQYPGGAVRLKRTVFVLTQLDEALYAYYSTANGFPDSGTLRLDEPDYTNIEGGLGVFAISSQSVAYGDTSGNTSATP